MMKAKRVLCCILAVCLLLSVFPVSVSAYELGPDGYAIVSTEVELRKALRDGRNVTVRGALTLTSDLTIPEGCTVRARGTLTIPADRTVTLDGFLYIHAGCVLNGKIVDDAYGSLMLDQSSMTGNGSVSVSAFTIYDGNDIIRGEDGTTFIRTSEVRFASLADSIDTSGVTEMRREIYVTVDRADEVPSFDKDYFRICFTAIPTGDECTITSDLHANRIIVRCLEEEVDENLTAVIGTTVHVASGVTIKADYQLWVVGAVLILEDGAELIVSKDAEAIIWDHNLGERYAVGGLRVRRGASVTLDGRMDTTCTGAYFGIPQDRMVLIEGTVKGSGKIITDYDITVTGTLDIAGGCEPWLDGYEFVQRDAYYVYANELLAGAELAEQYDAIPMEAYPDGTYRTVFKDVEPGEVECHITCGNASVFQWYPTRNLRLKDKDDVIVIFDPTTDWVTVTTEWENLYSDVPDGEWYSEAVRFATEQGLMKGMGNAKFEPQSVMSRAMLVTVLWRYAGAPAAENALKFTDVKGGEWFAEAVNWASGCGIVSGMGNNIFAPNAALTRAQLVTILFRYVQKNGLDSGKRANLKTFPDEGKVFDWAEEALQWAVAEGIITGIAVAGGSTVNLDPNGGCTRAQVATILMRFIENLAEVDAPETDPVF